MKTSDRDLTEVYALFTLPIEDEADVDAVSAEFHRRVQRDLRILNNPNRRTPKMRFDGIDILLITITVLCAVACVAIFAHYLVVTP